MYDSNKGKKMGIFKSVVIETVVAFRAVFKSGLNCISLVQVQGKAFLVSLGYN